MPELPEVERFCELLRPLVSTEHHLKISFVSSRPTSKKFPRFSIEFPFHEVDSENTITERSGRCPVFVHEINRKGKLICIQLRHGACVKDQGICPYCRKKNPGKRYMFLHMGMTGRISTPNSSVLLESLRKIDKEKEAFPPPHTHLLLSTGEYQVSLSDPRKFGSVIISESMESFDRLAPDALQEDILKSESLKKLIGQKKGIKALLLDQNYAFSGIGNWVVDEILYHASIHPNQNYLSVKEVESIGLTLQNILVKAIHCLSNDEQYPMEWIFHRRWRNVKNDLKDKISPAIKFITAGGRTSAIIPSQQKLLKRSVDDVIVAQKKQKVEKYALFYASMHPNQNYLSVKELERLGLKLQHKLVKAIYYLSNHERYFIASGVM